MGLITDIDQLQVQGYSFSPEVLSFVKLLAASLPAEADPSVDTEDGTNIDIFWHNRLVVSMDSDEAISISYFENGNHDFQFFYWFSFNGLCD